MHRLVPVVLHAGGLVHGVGEVEGAGQHGAHQLCQPEAQARDGLKGIVAQGVACGGHHAAMK